ncbi:MAG: endonuclease/exonuclease/phosphatase family protein [Anaerolineales bacterium]
MKKNFPVILAFAIVFLFLIQAAGTLVESIYILDLMNTNLDAKVLGVLFFFTPILLIPFYKKYPRLLVWISFAVLFISRGLLPFLNTSNRLLASGFATGASLSLSFLLLTAKPRQEDHSQAGLWGSAGLALAVGFSILLRTLNFGIDYSLTIPGGWAGLAFGLSLGWMLAHLDTEARPLTENKPAGVTSSILGFFLILTLVWFVYSAPSVIARWTEGSYPLIVVIISLLALAWVFISLVRPDFLGQVSSSVLFIWNLAFTLSLTGTILVHAVPFPTGPESAAVVVGSPAWWQSIPLVLMLLLFPVIFLDLRLFLDQVQRAAPSPRLLVPGILVGTFVLILLIFVDIFTNVWGYVKPVSLVFRGKYWLPFLLSSGIITLLIWRVKRTVSAPRKESGWNIHWAWSLLLSLVFLGTLLRLFPTKRANLDAAGKTSLVVMTFNIQGANDGSAQKSYDRQLALIRSVSPDILSLQETDTTRISLNNNDYVRYYAESLGYYSYFGPTTVAGTFGTAILSKLPLLNTRTTFSYSDTDEIGTAEAEVEVGGQRFNIFDVHPDGSDTAMLVFARTLLDSSKSDPYVIALGDYNLRDYEAPYQLINSVYTTAWTSVYPSKISTSGVDMSGDNRIDHIFVTKTLRVRDPVYVLPPASATDHPVHWAEIFWGNP